MRFVLQRRDLTRIIGIMAVMKTILKKSFAAGANKKGRKPTSGLGDDDADTAGEKVQRNAFCLQIQDPRARRAAYGRMTTAMQKSEDGGILTGFNDLDQTQKATFLLNWMIDPSFAKSRRALTVLTKEETHNSAYTHTAVTAWQLEQLEGERRCERFGPWSEWVHGVNENQR